ncbi:MAG: alkaline phosphatase family protein [Thermoanaerobaculia bacterium]
MTRAHSGWVLFWIAACVLATGAPAQAYIGPGAGIALLGSFAVVFVTIIIAVALVLTWPFRTLYRMLRRRGQGRPWIKRLIVVGFDGQDPTLTERLLAEGKLPNFQKLADRGCYSRLRTTYPSISPVAWSSFSTGVEPSKHRMFDFLEPDRKTYLPLLSSTRIGKVTRFLKLGRFRIPLQKPEVRLTRGSKAFWSILGESNTWSTVLRVPITFPPEKFYGAQLSAMCTPDLLGTQGTFFLFSTRPGGEKFKEGGARHALRKNGGSYVSTIEGPENSFLEGNPPLTLPLEVRPDPDKRRARLRVGDQVVDLEPGQLSDWVSLAFPAAPGVKVHGITRMMLTEMGEHISVYMTPLNIDPENPAMPISHPSFYSTYLAKRIGPFATLGLAEDTWALNEGVIDDDTFLKLTYDIDRERKDMFWTSLKRQRGGTLTCVFDATDRIQHMFWRYTEKDHPAACGKDPGPNRDAIEKHYLHNDAFVGEILGELRDDDLLIVLSDHGFTSFRRGVNLNAWLLANGYLKLKDGADGSAEWLRDVDWSATKAYALGLAGLFLNVKDREGEGIVEAGEEAQELKKELLSRLNGLRDEEKDAVGIREVFDTPGLYQGPYVKDAPDLLLGYNHGYRASWDCATGVVSGPIFEDNTKAWSGDHTVDPRLVPGVLFCNHPIDADDPGLIDMAPTVLRLFGKTPPPHMDGKPLFERPPGEKEPSDPPVRAA